MGESQTAIICCISQLNQNYEESKQSLLFCQKAKCIKTQAYMNEIIKEQPDRIAAKIAQYMKDIEDLKNEVDEKNK